MRLIKSQIHGATLLKLLLGFRILTISGRYGGGKTLLAVALAYWLKASGKVDKIVANFPVKYNEDDGSDLRRTAIILDESWMYITSRQSVLDYSAYLRKIDSYLLLPSVFDIHYRLSFFSAERIYNFQNFGLPIWTYKWYLSKGRTRDSGTFNFTNPQVFFGTYDTNYIPFDDEGISRRLKKTIKGLQDEPDKHSTITNDYMGIDDNSSLDNPAAILDDFEDRLSFMAQEMDIQLQDAAKEVKKTSRRR